MVSVLLIWYLKFADYDLEIESKVMMDVLTS